MREPAPLLAALLLLPALAAAGPPAGQAPPAPWADAPLLDLPLLVDEDGDTMTGTLTLAPGADLACEACVHPGDVAFPYAGAASKGGPASDALRLQGLASGQFLRSDASGTLAGALTVTGDLTVQGRLLAEGPWRTARAYGAIPDDGGDDTAALQAAIDATPLRGVLHVPAGLYRIAGDPALVFPRAITVWANGAIFDYGANDGTALHVGVRGNTHTWEIYLHGFEVRRTFAYGGTTSEMLRGTGILHSNVKGGRLADFGVSGFGIGLHVLGDGEGNALNTFEIQWLSNNHRQLVIDARGQGWANENTFLGGNFFLSDAFQGFAGSRYVHIVQAGNNNHRVIGATLESDVVERRLDVAGWYNLFLGNRYEGSNRATPADVDVEFRPGSAHNVVMYGYFGFDTSRIRDQGTANALYTGPFVGLGTASPKASLHVYDANGGRLRVEGGNTDLPAALELVSDFESRGRGVVMATGNDASWFAGVPYGGGAYAIGRHATSPHLAEHSLVVVRPSGDVGIGTRSPAAKLHVAGNLVADGHIYAHGSSHVGDAAEPVAGEGLAPGDVVVADGFTPQGRLRVAKAATPRDPRVVGVVSSNPSLLLAGQPGDTALAVAGIVPVKVAGPVRVGDLLASSEVPGHARACPAPAACAGAVLGKALAAHEGPAGLVAALVALA